MRRPSENILKRLWRYFQSEKTPSSIEGSQYPLVLASNSRFRQNLDIPEQPIRQVIDVATSRKLIEMCYWSFEVQKGISFLSSDLFQQVDGSSGSWKIKTEEPDGEPVAVNPDVLVIAEDLQKLRDGKELVLGGDRLQKAAREMLHYGDSFLELGIERDGLGSWGINSSCYLPALSVFVEQSEQGKVQQYRQQRNMYQSDSDILLHPGKVLHFSYEKNQRYGMPLCLAQLPYWEDVQKADNALSKAANDLGVNPWLHIMPETVNEKLLGVYERKHKEALRDGIVTNLYLLNGADVRKAGADAQALQPLIDHYLMCRRRMVPAGVPLWMFPDLSFNDVGGRADDLNGQPAMHYSRIISSLRSLLGEQVKWAISLELVMKKGFDWYQENGHFEIVWGDWYTTPGELAMRQIEQGNQGGGVNDSNNE